MGALCAVGTDAASTTYTGRSINEALNQVREEPVRQVNIHEAKTQLSRLVDEAAAGEEIVIARAGKPVAKLVPFTLDQTPRRLGSMRGKIWVADDFDAPLPPEVLSGFDGNE